jgi:hypothetical protein
MACWAILHGIELPFSTAAVTLILELQRSVRRSVELGGAAPAINVLDLYILTKLALDL